MVMKNKDWSINFTRPAAARALTEAGFTPLLSQVLALRGVENAAQHNTRQRSQRPGTHKSKDSSYPLS